MIHIVIVARAITARAGLRAILEDDPNVLILSDEPTIDQVVSTVWDEADVIVLDGSGVSIDAVAALTLDSPPGIVILGGSSGVHAALLDLHAAVGLLDSDASSPQIRAALRAVAVGFTVIPQELGGQLMLPRSREDESDTPDLTVREREVLQLVAAGLPNKGIAHRLSLSEHTVKYHLASVLSKLGAASRAEAVAHGVRRGFIVL
ncbi:MAG: LuxR C-terminal-related transcriptional regulator [Chloroflexota bacterium]